MVFSEENKKVIDMIVRQRQLLEYDKLDKEWNLTKIA